MKLNTLKTETHLCRIPLTIWILADIHPIRIEIIIIFNIYRIFRRYFINTHKYVRRKYKGIKIMFFFIEDGNERNKHNQ